MTVTPTTSQASSPRAVFLPGINGPSPALGPFADILLETNSAIETNSSGSGLNPEIGATGNPGSLSSVGEQGSNSQSSSAAGANTENASGFPEASSGTSLSMLAAAIEASLGLAGQSTPGTAVSGIAAGSASKSSGNGSRAQPGSQSTERSPHASAGNTALNPFAVLPALPNPSDKVFFSLSPGLLLKGQTSAPEPVSLAARSLTAEIGVAGAAPQAAGDAKLLTEVAAPISFSLHLQGVPTAVPTPLPAALASPGAATPSLSQAGPLPAVPNPPLSHSPSPAGGDAQGATAPPAPGTNAPPETTGATHADASPAPDVIRSESFPSQAQSGGKDSSQSDDGQERPAPSEHSISNYSITAAGLQEAAHANQPLTRASTDPAPPAAPSLPADNTQQQTQRPTREIALRLGQGDAPSVSVQLLDRNGSVQVAVRTHDTDLSARMQSNLDQLVNSLKQQGIDTDAWTPARTDLRNHAEAAQAQGRNSEGNSSGGDAGQQRQRQRRDRRPAGLARPAASFVSNLNP